MVIHGVSRDIRMTELTDPSQNDKGWQTARVVAIERATSRIKNFSLAPQTPFQFYPGQHVDVKLTAEDGYTTLRSYSIASSPIESSRIELSIERLDDGEVSPFFHDVVVVGDDVELRGPLGGHFILRPEDVGPILLIAGGSGVVPLMSMVRFQQSRELPVSMVLAVSARTWDDILYRDELLGLEAAISDFHVIFVLTRDSPRRPTDYGRRMDSMIVTDSLRRLPEPPIRVYICGSNPFVNTAADSVIRSGLSPQIIRTERYGG
jgi:ferredoxin-NADP reductase